MVGVRARGSLARGLPKFLDSWIMLRPLHVSSALPRPVSPAQGSPRPFPLPRLSLLCSSRARASAPSRLHGDATSTAPLSQHRAEQELG